MKKSILFLCAGMQAAIFATAQIPNNSFENWTTVGSYQNPDGWDNLNSMTSVMSVYTCTKGTPGNVGAAYIKLISKNVSGMGVMPGIATTGIINPTNMSVSGGFTFTSRPQSLTGVRQFMPGTGDAGLMAAYLTKWNSSMGMRDTIAKVSQNLTGMAMSWTSFTMNFTYLSGANPDTALIILSSSGMTPVANSYLYVDNLAFSGSVTGITENAGLLTNVSVYPNPASEKITIEFLLKKNSPVKIQVIDLSGKIVKELSEQNLNEKICRTIELSALAKGIYFVKILAGDIIETKKITIE